MAGDEGGAGDDFVADLLQGVEDIVRLRAELQSPAPLVPVVGGRTGLNTESSNYILNILEEKSGNIILPLKSQ